MRNFKDNGLTIILMLMFAASLGGQLLTGWHYENDEMRRHGQAAIGLWAYAVDPGFLSALFENWESEFLQMSVHVVLTAMLFQRGSAESRDPDEPPRDKSPEEEGKNPGSPAALRAGAVVRWLYAHSLGLTLFALFIASFIAHWQYSARAAAEEARAHGEQPPVLDRLPQRLATLVRKLPELAKRVSFDGGARRVIDIPAPSRISGIEAAQGQAQRHRIELTLSEHPAFASEHSN